MAFIDIKDPRKRDQIVEDYINTVKELQMRTENEKAGDLQQRIELEKQYTPLIEASKESTNKITKELKNNRAKEEGTVKGYWKPGYAKPALDYYLDQKSNIDKYYGIQKEADRYVMGAEHIDIDESSNIFVKGEKFEATPGLWELIMLGTPETWTPEDMSRYEDLLEKTQAIFNPIIKSTSNRPRQTNKYKKLLAGIEKTYQKAENEEEVEVETNEPENIGEYHDGAKQEKEEEEEASKVGQAIQYLPGDISGLLDRLKLLYAEREAGNISSTTNEIVGILDQLLRMKYIDRTEYNAVCKALSC